MKRVAFIVGPALGHFSRMHVVAWRLQEMADVEVRFFAPDRLRFDVDNFPGRLPLETIPIAPGSRPAVKDPATEPTTYAQFAPGIERALANFRPDIVIQDCNPLQWLSAVRFPDCPRLNATDVFLTRLAKAPTVQVRHFANAGSDINRVRESKGLEPLQTAYDGYEADRVLLLDPLQMIALFDPLPDHYRACGACSWSYPGAVPPELAGEGDLLLCSMGSTGRDADPQTIRAIREAAECAKSVFVSTDTEVDGPTGDPEDPHAFRYSRLALDPVYAHVKVAVSQGGAGSTYQALGHGKPVIAIPAHDNHRICGRLIAELGVGLCIEGENDVAHLEQVDFAGMTERAQSFGEEMRTIDGAGWIASEILALL